MRLMFIGPRNKPAEHPLIDELTMKMTGALRKSAEPGYRYCGVHVCVCGAVSGSTDVIFPNGWETNTPCVHYLAYHRDEVPASELEAVQTLAFGSEVPNGGELQDREFRMVREYLLVERFHDLGEELGPDMMSWTYELSLENRANVAVTVTRASVMLSLEGVYSPQRYSR